MHDRPRRVRTRLALGRRVGVGDRHRGRSVCHGIWGHLPWQRTDDRRARRACRLVNVELMGRGASADRRARGARSAASVPRRDRHASVRRGRPDGRHRSGMRGPGGAARCRIRGSACRRRYRPRNGRGPPGRPWRAVPSGGAQGRDSRRSGTSPTSSRAGASVGFACQSPSLVAVRRHTPAPAAGPRRVPVVARQRRGRVRRDRRRACVGYGRRRRGGARWHGIRTEHSAACIPATRKAYAAEKACCHGRGAPAQGSWSRNQSWPSSEDGTTTFRCPGRPTTRDETSRFLPVPAGDCTTTPSLGQIPMAVRAAEAFRY
ncbi:hypothetical protein EV384_4579 [Micromonospora kangleipakensis]|uniref:Uncharacterized protein n=1 Tax=Micromonospora kangleipakensis TaxID=1077942 RepID=A0A4Q8BDM2_9ACTN|nr:hypothetical protein EV384_4579 [Micromonospora kangleipakensis]